MEQEPQRKGHRFPWRDGNRLELLVDGGHFFPAMLAAIQHARSHVLMEMYLFHSGTTGGLFIEELIAATKRGVAVYLLLDDFGARELDAADRGRLEAAGVRLSFYNPLRYGALRRNLWRDHRKLLAVDGECAFVGGAGITDEFSAANPHHWHDVMVAIRGPCVEDWQRVFARIWQLWSQQALALPAHTPHTLADGCPGRVTINNPARMEIKRSLIKRVRNAERRVWIATAYFIPSWKIRRSLYHAARHGADVRLLLPGPHTDHPAVRHAGRRYYTKLLAAGVRIFEYQPRFLHAKILLCDHWVSLGSSNIDRWNFSWNLEANQEIDDQDFATEVAAQMESDFAQSREFLAAQWKKRSLRRRLQERFWGIVELWLERLSQKRGPRPRR